MFLFTDFYAAGKSIAQVALRWLLQKPVVSSVIIGATKVSQIDDNMVAAAGWELSPVEVCLFICFRREEI